ncbi:MAG: 4-hydroxy-tetrahydrodipicolinate synthase [Lachnospiraceae bacterium]|nr:4-hydroxy-tetrahydrodipicolinate synthase [Lachnospiraceae bacterium]
MAIFKGAGVAIVTPMKENGEINYDVYGELIEDQIAHHTDAIIAVGTSGEAPTLDDDEHIEAIRYAVEKTAHRIPVIAGTGSNNTAHAIMMSKEAEKAGADGLLLVAPYYNKATQKGLIAHYTVIAESTDLPCILYNVPSRTGTNLLPGTAAYLGKNVKNVAAVKEASGDISQVAKLIELADGSLDVYSGNDDQIVPICSLGGVGVISVLSNVAPQETHDMVQYCLDGNYAEAAKLQLRSLELCRQLFCEVNPIPVKAALNMQGFQVGIPRLPLTEMEEEHKAALKKAMIEFGVL